MSYEAQLSALMCPRLSYKVKVIHVSHQDMLLRLVIYFAVLSHA